MDKPYSVTRGFARSTHYATFDAAEAGAWRRSVKEGGEFNIYGPVPVGPYASGEVNTKLRAWSGIDSLGRRYTSLSPAGCRSHEVCRTTPPLLATLEST